VEKKKIRKNELEKTQIARVSQVFYLACVRIQHSPRKHITSVANLQPEVIEVTTIHHLQHETLAPCACALKDLVRTPGWQRVFTTWWRLHAGAIGARQGQLKAV